MITRKRRLPLPGSYDAKLSRGYLLVVIEYAEIKVVARCSAVVRLHELLVRRKQVLELFATVAQNAFETLAGFDGERQGLNLDIMRIGLAQSCHRFTEK